MATSSYLLTMPGRADRIRMATKAELITKLEEIMAQEDVETASEAVEGVKEAYEALVVAGQQQATAEHVPEGTTTEEAPPPTEALPIAIESAPLQDEDDKRFKQLLDAFNQRVNDIRRKRQKEEADNLEAKKAIMEELKTLIAGEENIGNAFQRFAELQEKWKTIGPIPQQYYRDLQNDYSHLRDEFFYHIRIYKELRDHDLRKNTALKQALISDVESLAQKDSVKELEHGVKEYQEKWHSIGPVVREEWEAIRDRFSTATRTIYDKIHEHYRARRTEHEANLAAKQVLVDKIVSRFGEDLSGKHFALWGLAFKPNTDDMREAPSRVIIAELFRRGATVTAYDPVAMDESRRIFGDEARLTYADRPMQALDGADALVIVTEWKEFRSPDFDAIKAKLKSPLIFDGRNIFDPALPRQAGLTYLSIGRP